MINSAQFGIDFEEYIRYGHGIYSVHCSRFYALGQYTSAPFGSSFNLPWNRKAKISKLKFFHFPNHFFVVDFVNERMERKL